MPNPAPSPTIKPCANLAGDRYAVFLLRIRQTIAKLRGVQDLERPGRVLNPGLGPTAMRWPGWLLLGGDAAVDDQLGTGAPAYLQDASVIR